MNGEWRFLANGVYIRTKVIMIKANARQYSLSALCKCLGIVRSSYYYELSSDRSYRKALPVDVIIAEIEGNAGTQFDPELVEPFVEVIRAIGESDLDELDIQ